MKIDCHVHLVGAAPHSGAFMSPQMESSLATRYLLSKLKLSKLKDPLARQERYLDDLARMVRESELDRIVLLAFDGVYTEQGVLDQRRTPLYVANCAVHEACQKRRELFLFGASVNPLRRDALDELERVAAQGAVLVKLLPNSQGFDPADPRCLAYYRKVAALHLPLLIHCGYEHTIKVIDQSFGDPLRLRPALDEGATVIVAHAGAAGLGHLKETFGRFLGLLVRYPNCFGDLSALCNLWRSRYLKLLLDPPRLFRKYAVDLPDPMARMVHGSDYPIPITPVAFVRQTSRKQRQQIRKSLNPLQSDIDLKRSLGMPDACLTRAYRELGIGRG